MCAVAELIEVSEGTKRIHCSNCGAELAYAPGTAFLLCGYCDTRNEIAESDLSIEEKDLNHYLNEQVTASETESHEALECGTCGAITSFDDRTAAQFCGFCGNHLLMKEAGRFTQIKPHALLPFAKSQKEAHLLFRTWLNGLWFAPNKLKHMANGPDGLQGIYIPFWTFDAQTSSDYTGERGDNEHYTESYTVNVNGRNESRTRTKTRIRWSFRSGHVDHFFDDVLVLGSTSLPEKQANKLDPWDLDQLVPFTEDYLRGFKVENYRVDLPNAFKTGKSVMEDGIKGLVRSDIGGDHQRIHSLKTEWSELTFKHILLPIWIASYPYKGKTYRFLVNGRTGEVQGERPYSAWKIALLVITILIIILVISLVSQ